MRERERRDGELGENIEPRRADLNCERQEHIGEKVHKMEQKIRKRLKNAGKPYIYFIKGKEIEKNNERSFLRNARQSSIKGRETLCSKCSGAVMMLSNIL